MFNEKNNISITNKSVFFILTLLAVFIYHGAISHEFIRYDDQVYLSEVVGNQSDFFSMLIWAFTNSVNANWHPLTLTSLIIDYKLYDDNPAGYYLTSIFFHVLNAFLVFLIARVLTDKRIALVVALIFIAHPLTVETTAWIAERKGILGAFFALLSIHFFLKYKTTVEKKYYLFSIISFISALMSKAVFVTLPFLFIVLDLYLAIINNKEVTKTLIRNSIIESIPFLLISLVIGLVTISAHEQSGALGVNMLFPLDIRIQKAISTIPIYLKQLIYPLGLYIPYTYKIPSLTSVIFGFVTLLSFTFIALKYMKHSPTFFLGWFWYLILLLPVSGILQSGFHAHADRYAYTPIVGLILFLVVYISEQIKKININKRMINLITILIITFLSSVSWFQHSHWKNTMTLFHNTYNNDNDNFMANAILAGMYLANNEIDSGMKHYILARDSAPTFMSLYHTVASSLVKHEMPDKALMVLDNGMEAIAYANTRVYANLPKYESSRNTIISDKARLHLQRKEYKEVIEHVNISLNYFPQNHELIALGGKAHFMLKENEKAEQAFLKSIEINPQYYQAYYFLLSLYLETKKNDAIRQLKDTMLSKFPNKGPDISQLVDSFK